MYDKINQETGMLESGDSSLFFSRWKKDMKNKCKIRWKYL